MQPGCGERSKARILPKSKSQQRHEVKDQVAAYIHTSHLLPANLAFGGGNFKPVQIERARSTKYRTQSTQTRAEQKKN